MNPFIVTVYCTPYCTPDVSTPFTILSSVSVVVESRVFVIPVVTSLPFTITFKSLIVNVFWSKYVSVPLKVIVAVDDSLLSGSIAYADELTFVHIGSTTSTTVAVPDSVPPEILIPDVIVVPAFPFGFVPFPLGPLSFILSAATPTVIIPL